MQRSKKEGICQLCDRTTPLTFHHLIPRKVHRRTRFKKQYSKGELETGINICSLCHTGVHRLYDEMTLAQQFNTIESLIADQSIQAHIQWVAKQKRGLIDQIQ